MHEVDRRTSVLEQRMDELDLLTGTHVKELKIIREENLTLQAHLEDFESKARHSNLRIRGIPATMVDLQSTIMALFQKPASSIPVERLKKGQNSQIPSTTS